MKRDAVEGLVDCVSRSKVGQALNEMKKRNAIGPSDVLLELIDISTCDMLYVNDPVVVNEIIKKMKKSLLHRTKVSRAMI